MSPTRQRVVAVAVVFPCLSTIAVALRFYVRKMKKTQLKSDDWTILASLVLTWFMGILLIVGSAIGSFGGHTAINPKTGADVVTSKERNAVKLEWSMDLVAMLNLGIIKLSVLLLYQRLFVGRTFQRYSHIMCAVIILWSLAFFFASAFQCGTHIEYWWTSAATIIRYCDNTDAASLGFVISDVITDFMILAIPLPIVWKLQISAIQKVCLCGVFLLGLLSTAAGTVRMTVVIFDVYNTTVGYRDLRAVVTHYVVWTHIEASTAVVAACLPTIRPLFLGMSPESLIGSIRSVLSLNSFRSQYQKRRGSDNETLHHEDGFNLDLVRKSEPSIETQVTGNSSGHKSVRANQILMQHGLSFEEERVGDMTV